MTAFGRDIPSGLALRLNQRLIRAILQEQFNHWALAVFGSPVQGTEAIRLRGIGIRAMFEQQTGDFKVLAGDR